MRLGLQPSISSLVAGVILSSVPLLKLQVQECEEADPGHRNEPLGYTGGEVNGGR